MSSILVLNLGSTSFKYELFDSVDLVSLKKGSFKLAYQAASQIQDEVDRHFREVLRQIGDISQIKAIGHRVVHGGDKYLASQEIVEKEIVELEKLNQLAPLHNPFNLAGIKASNKYLPEVKDVAVFDTAFFKDLPEVVKIYPIPYEYFQRGVKKFGFHGISHKYAAQEAAKQIKKPFDKANIISVHLGGGCSVAAIAKGKPIDTSMGFTPLEGLMMMTRCGDIGEGVVIQILEDLLAALPAAPGTDGADKQTGQDLLTTQRAVDRLRHILNFESGVKGISGHDDFLELLKAVNWGEPKSKLAFEMFIHRVKKYIGAYCAILGEVDAVVFTGKIGAGKPVTRQKIYAKIKILENVEKVVVEPWEELAIAKEVLLSLS